MFRFIRKSLVWGSLNKTQFMIVRFNWCVLFSCLPISKFCFRHAFIVLHFPQESALSATNIFVTHPYTFKLIYKPFIQIKKLLYKYFRYKTALKLNHEMNLQRLWTKKEWFKPKNVHLYIYIYKSLYAISFCNIVCEDTWHED